LNPLESAAFARRTLISDIRLAPPGLSSIENIFGEVCRDARMAV
jgi:hypothetical protein